MTDKLGEGRSGEKPEIKVVDRRSFTSDGQRRDEPAEEPPSRPPAPEPPPEPPVQGPGFTMHEDPEGETARAERDAAFLNLCVSIYESGCMHLGMDREGAESGGEINLDGARGAIAMIEMLKRKTDGNLSTEEQKILESLLADLQMAYVMKAQTASS